MASPPPLGLPGWLARAHHGSHRDAADRGPRWPSSCGDGPPRRSVVASSPSRVPERRRLACAGGRGQLAPVPRGRGEPGLSDQAGAIPPAGSGSGEPNRRRRRPPPAPLASHSPPQALLLPLHVNDQRHPNVASAGPGCRTGATVAPPSPRGGGRGAPRGRDGPHPRRGPGPGLGHLAARLAARRARLLRARATFPRAPAPGPRSPPPRPGKCLDPPPPGRSPSGRPSPHWASPGRLFSFLPGVTGLPAFHAGPGGDLASARVSNPYIIQSVAPRAEWSCTLQHAEGAYSEVQSPGGLKPLVNGGGAGVCRSSPAGAGTPSGLPSAGFAGAGPE